MGHEIIQTNHDAEARVESRAYEEYKEFNGRKYTGMKVGGSHKWYYDKGTWDEKKITPDKWELTYAANKKRAWDAPEGSGVPVEQNIIGIFLRTKMSENLMQTITQLQ